jgi:hypothetical protein
MAAEWIRKRMLRGQIGDAHQHARDLWWLAQTAYGFGGMPPPGTEDQLWNAAREAERLTLEYQASL